MTYVYRSFTRIEVRDKEGFLKATGSELEDGTYSLHILETTFKHIKITNIKDFDTAISTLRKFFPEEENQPKMSESEVIEYLELLSLQ